MHVKTKDTVIVISGKDKGKKGKITAAFPKLNRVTVEGVNVVTKHQKARNAQQPGGIIHKDMPIDASNVMLVCPKCGKATRVSHKVERGTDENGKATRSMIRKSTDKEEKPNGNTDQRKVSGRGCSCPEAEVRLQKRYGNPEARQDRD